jgi:hypothetical protein
MVSAFPGLEESWDRTADSRAEAVLFIRYPASANLTEHDALSDKILTTRQYIILEQTYFDEKDLDEQFLDH